MPRKGSMVVPESSGPIPQDACVMLSVITPEDIRRIMSDAAEKVFNKHFEQKPDNLEGMRATEQLSASLEQDAREQRLAVEADVTADKKTRERTEGAAAAVQAKHGDSCSAKRVQAGPTSSTSSGMKAEPPVLPRWDDVLIERGAAAPKSCLSPAEMRTPTAAGALLPTGIASSAMRTIFSQPLPSWTLREEVKERTSRANNNQLAAPYWRKVIQSKSRKTLLFYPGGCTGRLRSCPVLRGRYALRI